MIRLVVNAQEFGSTPAADQDVLRAHRDGIVTSVSVQGNCVDLDRVRTSLADAPTLGVGLSIVLTGGSPVAKAQDVPSLMTIDGAFRTTPAQFAGDWLRDKIVVADIEREMEAQLRRVIEAGLRIDHLCTHGHVGLLPGVGQIVERVALRHRISGIRSTVETPTLSWLTDPRRGLRTGVMAGLSFLTRRRMGSLRHGPHTWGYVESGRLDEVRIIEIIGRLGPGHHELLCHPSANADERSGFAEWQALTSPKVKTAIERRGIVLCRWQDLV